MKVNLLYLIFLFVPLIISCSQNKFTTTNSFTMGTFISISHKKNESKIVENALNQLTLWISNLETDIDKINSAPINTTINNLTDDTNILLNLADKYHRISSGEYDITVNTLTSLYGFNSDKYKTPTADAITYAKGEIGFDNLKIDNNTVIKKSDLKIDLSATGKGYLVDKLSKYLIDNGIDNFIINIGGDMYVKGDKGKRLFNIAIQSPTLDKEFATTLTLKNKAVATSGNYERNIIDINGNKINHIFSGISLESVNRYQSVSVIADTVEEADSFATVFYLLDLKKIEKLCAEYNVAVMIIDDKSEVIKFCNFAQYENSVNKKVAE